MSLRLLQAQNVSTLWLSVVREMSIPGDLGMEES